MAIVFIISPSDLIAKNEVDGFVIPWCGKLRQICRQKNKKNLVSNMSVLNIWPLLRVQFIIVWMRKVKKPLKLSLCEVFHGIPSLCGLNISKLGVKRFIVRFPNPLTDWIDFFQVRRGPCPSVLLHGISASVSVFQVYNYSVCAPLHNIYA